MSSAPRLLSTVAIGWISMLLAATSLMAHPSAKLVWDPLRRVIYYSDLYRVWQIDRLGRRTVAVADVHTHYLRIGLDGHLYGDDREHVSDPVRARVRVWRLTPNGRLEDVIPWKHGRWVDDYGFVADENGNLYWASCPGTDGPCVVKRRSGESIEVGAGGAEFARPLEYLAEDGRGGVLLADGPDIRRITSAGVLETVALGVSQTSGRWSIMGMYAAADGSLYVAAFDDRVVLRMTWDGRRSVVARSPSGWRPTAVLESSGDLWVLEYDEAERAQVRLLTADGRVRVWGPGS